VSIIDATSKKVTVVQAANITVWSSTSKSNDGAKNQKQDQPEEIGTPAIYK